MWCTQIEWLKILTFGSDVVYTDRMASNSYNRLRCGVHRSNGFKFLQSALVKFLQSALMWCTQIEWLKILTIDSDVVYTDRMA